MKKKLSCPVRHNSNSQESGSRITLRKGKCGYKNVVSVTCDNDIVRLGRIRARENEVAEKLRSVSATIAE